METSQTVKKFEIERPVQRLTGLKHKRKRLTNKQLGVGYEVPAGLTWRAICDEILCDGTNPLTLSRVAKGQLKSTNGWEVTLLD
jgi:hypothetical protein